LSTGAAVLRLAHARKAPQFEMNRAFFRFAKKVFDAR
jgi:hypothetical protein